MAELAVDLTYGTALIEAARETQQEQRILEEGMQLSQILQEEPDLKKFLAYPGIAADEKKEVLRSIFEDRICRELLNFLYVLIDKRRASRFESILRVYKKLVEQEEGVLYGTVLSVVGLDDMRLSEIEGQVSRLLQTKVHLTNEMDPGLLAGVKVFIDGRIIDASYRKKLDELSADMRRS
ncbi:MAG: ATP synthase F1 subunit delta [Firmicutes bacterium]|nr:ATP synthase F1 subunit delta [Bacillota bacterium]